MDTKNATAYKFRAECAADVQAVRAVLLPWAIEWSERRTNLDFEGARHVMPDVDVEFTVDDDAPTLNEMIWLLDAIDNCHVASQTLAIAELYTGEREIRETFEAPAKRPSASVLQQVKAAVRTRQNVLGIELERVLQLHRAYDSAARLGDKWQPFYPHESRPGWLVPVEHAPGLTSLRKIDVPLGCKKWEKLGDGLVKARMSAIHA